MSGASSTVSGMVKSGAISTMPPTLAAAMIAKTKPMADRSYLRWNNSGIFLLRWARCSARGGSSIRQLGICFGAELRSARRHPDIVTSDDNSEQEQKASESARDVVRIHGNQRVDEGIGQRPVIRIGAPHQALDNSGVPHSEDVDEGPRD